jgi:glycosyltransferase involved in cell wall biosynthesis
MRPIALSNVLVCGTARNVASKIESFLEVCDGSFSGFNSLQYLICESFSTDRTVEELEELARKRSNFNWFTDSTIDINERLRTNRIASARNQIIKKVRTDYSTVDYIVMADLDGVNRDLTQKSVESCWRLEEWDMVSANQPLKYYDIWALRASGWSETDCWAEYEELRLSMSKREARRKAVTSKMRSITRSHAPIKVRSAFGGLAIYKKNVFLEGTYKGFTTDGVEVCEHVSFHQDLLDKNRSLFINPRLVNLNEMSQLRNIFIDFGRRLSTKLRK